MKKYIITIVGALLLGLLSITTYQSNAISNLEKDIILLKTNEKALIGERDTLESTAYMYSLQVAQLSYFNDSITKKLKQAVSDNKIKDKDIKQLQYMLTINFNKDSIIVKDTIFKEPNFKLDTVLSDKWHTIKLELEYPNKISTESTYKNEFSTIIAAQKDFVNPRKKFFLSRWFQKKHTVIKVDVKDNSPYSEIKEQRFIQIID